MRTSRRRGLSALVLGSFLVALPLRADAPATRVVESYRRCWQSLNDRDWRGLEACYAPGAVSTLAGRPVKGPRAIVDARGIQLAAAFPDIKAELQLVIANGERATAIAFIGGTHDGPLRLGDQTLPASGRPLRQLVAHSVEARGGKATSKEWFVQDRGSLLGQLGASKAPFRASASSAGPTPRIVLANNDADEKQTLALAKKLYAGMTRRDPKLFDLVADDIVEHNQSQPEDMQGKAAVTASLQGFWAMSSDLKVRTSVLYAAGEYAVMVGGVKGTNDGEMPGLGKTGRSFDVDLIEIGRWQGGKLIELWSFLDGVQLITQLTSPAR